MVKGNHLRFQVMQATTIKWGGRLPKQIKRTLPLYLACVLFLVFLRYASSFFKATTVLKRDLSYSYSYSYSYQPTGPPSAKFPRKIWQTWKVDPLRFEERDLTRARSWTEKNPGHRYEVLTDSNDMHFVETHFGPGGLNRVDIVYMYRTLTARIVKADLLRYLILYIEGGVYADIDVEALKPIDRFIPEDRYRERDIEMVVGVEVDQPEYENHTILGPKSRSFCQWTFMCKPRSPILLRIIDGIVHWLNDVARQQEVPISELTLDFNDVLSGTGPSAFTKVILAEMSRREGRPVAWDTFHALSESKLVGGVLVLTVEAFCAGQGHSDSGTHNSKTALVKHHFHASGWPSNHPRNRHPVYGEVEKCNWEKECVRKWDEDTAVFATLGVQEQERLIREAEAKAEADKAAGVGGDASEMMNGGVDSLPANDEELRRRTLRAVAQMGFPNGL